MKKILIYAFLLFGTACQSKLSDHTPAQAAVVLAISDSLVRSGQLVPALVQLNQLIAGYTAGSASPEARLGLVSALIQKGNILFRLKRYNEAYRSYYIARLELDRLPKTCQRASVLFEFYATLANVSYGQNQFMDAVNQQRHAIAAFHTCPPDNAKLYLVQGALDNIGLSFMQAGHTDSALAAYREALSVINQSKPVTPGERVRFSVAKGVVLGNLGTAFLKSGDTVGAAQYYRQSIELNQRPGHAVQDALVTRMKLADLYVSRGNWAKTSALLDTVNAAKEALPEPQDKLQLLLLNARFNKAIGNLKAAALYYERYIRDMDSLRRQKLRLLNTDYGKEFELLENDYELAGLQRRNQLQDLYLAGAAIFCLFAGSILLVILRGRRRSRQHMQDIEYYNDQLKSTLEENEKLLGVVAHDLKNPLSAIQVLSEMLKDEAPADSESKDSLAMISTATQAMSAVIDELMGAAASRTITASEREDLDLKVLLLECTGLLRQRAQDKGQRIIVTATQPAWVFANRSKMWRVINNLLINAIKFSPAKGLIYADLTVAGHEVIVAIRDEGIGMSAAMLARLFDQKSENRRQGTSGEQSHGLGLGICRRIILDKGGRIWAESEPEHGTTIFFSLPLTRTDS